MAVSECLAARVRDTACQLGTYHLPTGETICSYFDEFLLAADPDLLRDVAVEMSNQLPDDIDAVVGIELGGIPLAVALSAVSGVPAAFLRRRRKTYGTYRQVEGTPVAGKRVALVDDVVRSGSQLLRGAAVLHRQGSRVRMAACVLDRDLGGRDRLAGAGIKLWTLLADETIDAEESA